MNLLIFDMDGVLVDVSASYRETIQQTVEHFTGRRVTRDQIQAMKNQGGFNDDWDLSDHLIRDLGVTVPFNDIVEYFQGIFLGGLIQQERWIAADGLFDRLSRDHALSVFTGRLHEEANLTLDRFAPGVFPHVVGVDDVPRRKPAPDGILKLRAAIPHDKVWYIGDTVDDARAALAAGVPFIGIADPEAPMHRATTALLKATGAITVLDDINSLEQVL